jgi:Ca-activated chloride channel family protein
MSFQNPWMLLALLAIPLAVGLYLLAERRRMRYAVRFTNLEVLAAVTPKRAWRRYVPPILFLLALTALCLGLARPTHKTLVAQDRATVILVVDVSRSMEARDVKPTRLRAAEAAIRKFLGRVPSRVRVGLVAFAGDPQVATPPTTDRGTVREAIDTLQWFPRYGGTAIGDALAAAVELGQAATRTGRGDLAAVTTAAARNHGLVSILLLSDGAQTRGMLQPEEGAERAKAAGIPVYTIALGTPNGRLRFDFGGRAPPPGIFPSPGGGGGGGGGGFGGPNFGRSVPVPPDPETLKAIATTTGGRFFAARNAESLRAAYTSLGSSLGRKPGRSEITYVFVAIAAGLLLAAGLLSAAWSPRLP